MTLSPRPFLSGLAAASIALALALAPAAAASAAPLVSVTVADQPTLANIASDSGPTTLSVSGSGFQSIENGFGGIYVLFGWVDASGAWQPSAGGVTGTSYRYAMDDESAPQGYQQFLAFPGSSTEGAASGGIVNADGTWSTTITTAGPVFASFDRDNVETTVDCLAVQCGIITIGAHGVVNPSNESFTPVTFTDLQVAASPTPTPTPASTVPTKAEPEASPEPTSTAAAAPAVDSDGVSAVLPMVLGAAGVLVAAAAIALLMRARRAAK
jgi:hypothetical protein